MNDFAKEVTERIEANGRNAALRASARAFVLESLRAQYSYNFSWLGRPIIQYPQDIVALQEIIWRVRPDLIVETGIAHGGSLVMSASMLALLDYCEAAHSGKPLAPADSHRLVLGVDIDIRAHNLDAIRAHPLAHMIEMLKGSSTDPEVIQKVRERAGRYSRVLVCLDSNHTHDHVLAELEAYAPLVSAGSYCVVFDTVIDDVPRELFPNRPWGPRDSPKSAVHEFLENSRDFEIDSQMDSALLISVAPSGFLRRKSQAFVSP